MIFVGQLSDTNQLAAIGLGQMVIVLLPYSLIVGVATALETLVSAAYGREDYRSCGLYLHRSIFIMTLIYVPVAIAMWNAGAMLQCIGIDPVVAGHVASLVRNQLVAVYLVSIDEAITLFLTTMEKAYVCMVIQIFTLPLHTFNCWLFISHLQCGIRGAAYAETATALFEFVVYITYASCLKDIREAWFLPTRQTFYNLKEFMGLACPGILMLFLENMNMEVLVLMAGFLGRADLIAAQSIVVALAEISIMVPYGMSLGAVTLVG